MSQSLRKPPSILALVAALLSLVCLGQGSVLGQQYLRLEDVVAGGDGSGTAPPANTGIDPRTGGFVTSYFAGQIFDADGVSPTPVPSSPYLDSVFFLSGGTAFCPGGICAGLYRQPITRSGVTAIMSDAHDLGYGWNFILKDRNGGVSEPGIRVGGADHFTTAIGLHASMGITFNLDELRGAHGDAAVGCFSTFWGMDDCGSGQVELMAILANDAGVIDSRSSSFAAGQGDFLSFEIPRGARYLTLATGSWGSFACDQGTFARPIITPLPCPEPSESWIWSIWPSRVRPEGEPVVVNGEALYDDYSIRVAGVDLLNQEYWSDTQRYGVTPPLAPGIYDADLHWFGVPEARRDRAVEVAPPPVVTAVVPSQLLHDRPTAVRIEGVNLRRDMRVLLGYPGDDAIAGVLQDQQFVSDQLITGSLPPLVLAAQPLGPRRVDLLDQGRRRMFSGLLTYVDSGIERVEPSTVSTEGGTEVTFFGLNLNAATAYRIGGQPLTNVVVLDPGRVRGMSPPLPQGPQAAELVAAGGAVTFTLAGAVTAVAPAPLAIASVNPYRVYSVGGAVVTIVTTTSHGGATPRVDGIELVNAEVVDALTLRGEVPPLEPGFHDVDLVNAAGDVIAAALHGLEVLSDAGIAITAVSPATVSTLGGTEVTFTGRGFSPGFVPRLGGEPLVEVVVESTTRLRGVSPPLPAGLKDAALDSGRLTVASLTRAVEARPPAEAEAVLIGQVRPARITAGGLVRFIGADFPGDVVPRIGGVVLDDVRAVSSCRFEGRLPSGGGGGGLDAAPLLPPGLYTADLYRPGFGVVAELDGGVEVAAPGAAPRPTHVVSPPVQVDGSTRLFIFGNDFSPETEVRVGGRPLTGLTVVSDELIVGNAPALAAGETPGLRDVRAEDSRGGATLTGGVRYEPAEGGFIRGDPNSSGIADLSDAIYVLGFLFLGSPTAINCREAADLDANGAIDISDAVSLLQFLFLGGSPPPPPYPSCGRPPVEKLGCDSFTACGGGGGGGGGGAVPMTLRDNVKLIAESPAGPLDARVVELAPEQGEVVLRDPPGGQDIRSGDVIAGFTPFHLDAVHQGVAYLLRVEREVGGSCVAASEGERVFKVSPATLRDVARAGAVTFKQSDFYGAKVIHAKTKLTGFCDAIATPAAGGGGLADGQLGGCVGECTSIHFDLPPRELVNLKNGDSYLRADLKRCKVDYDSGTRVGIEFSEDGLDRLSFFSGTQFDSEVEFYVKAYAHEHMHKEESLHKYQKSTIIFVGFPPVLIPILITVEAELIAGVELEAGIDLFADVGSRSHFKAGVGFEFDDERVQNTSTIDLPTVEPLPGTPVFKADGFVSVRGYLRPQLRLFGGLAVAVLTGNLLIMPELSTTAHAEFQSDPGCFTFGLGAEAKIEVHPEIKFLGWDWWDPKDHLKLIGDEWPDLVTGKIGCKSPPVAKLTRRLEQVGPQLHVHLDASGSFDPDEGPLNYRWDFDGDGNCDRNTGSNPRTTYIFDPATESPCRLDYCTHRIELLVTDDEQTSATAVTSFATQGQGLIQGAKVRLP